MNNASSSRRGILKAGAGAAALSGAGLLTGCATTSGGMSSTK